MFGPGNSEGMIKERLNNPGWQRESRQAELLLAWIRWFDAAPQSVCRNVLKHAPGPARTVVHFNLSTIFMQSQKSISTQRTSNRIHKPSQIFMLLAENLF